MARIFVGISLPDSMCGQLAALPHTLGHARWTRAGNLHLTLVFVGETERVAEIASALTAVTAEPFSLAIEGIGRFDKRVLWAGMADSEGLHALQRQVCACLDDAGIAFDDKPFRPHITLARLRKGQREEELAEYMERHGRLESPAFLVGAFHLYESVSTADGVRYRRLRRYSLST